MSSDVIIKNHEGQDVTYPGVSGIVLRTANGSALYLNVNDQPDWAQTDETAMNYIKNKPFYDNSLAAQCSFETLPEINFNALGYTFWQVADFTLEYSQIFSTVFDITQGSRTYSLTPTESEIMLNDEKILIFQSAELGYGFAICYTTGAFDVTVNGINVAVDVPATGVYFIYSQDNIPSADYLFKITYNDLKTLDKKFLPPDLEFSQKQADWDQTVQSEKDFIKNKPFYEYEGQIEILPLTKYEDFTFDSTYKYYLVGEKSNYLLSVGESYKVLWDDIEYECIAQDASSIMAGAVCIGNVFPDDNKPFIIMTLSTNNWSVYISLKDEKDGESHWVQITQDKMLVKQIDKKFIPIPFFGKENNVILDGTFQDTKYDSDGDGVDDTWYGEAIIEDSSDATLVVGETYTVTWNGVEYRCECMEVMGLPAVGNTIAVGGEDNGIPFAIGRDINGNTLGAVAWFAMPIELEDDGIYHCIISGNSIKKVDLQYLYQPDWNENNRNSGSYIANKPFGEITAGTAIVPEQNVNLTVDIAGNGELWASIVPNMGLSGYIVEGKNYNINFDGSYYMGIGVAQDNMGIGVIYQSDSTSIAIVDNFENTEVSLIMSNQSGQHTASVTCVEDIITKIDPKFLPEAGSSLPEVTSSDAGKFLRVSADGVWVAATIPNAEEASF